MVSRAAALFASSGFRWRVHTVRKISIDSNLTAAPVKCAGLFLCGFWRGEPPVPRGVRGLWDVAPSLGVASALHAQLANSPKPCNNNAFVFVLDSYSHRPYKCPLMKHLKAEITKRLVAAMLVAAAVVGVSALAMHTPSHNQNSAARSLKSIQTDKTTLFYADNWNEDRCRFVERVLPGTSESKAATENLKLIAAAF